MVVTGDDGGEDGGDEAGKDGIHTNPYHFYCCTAPVMQW